MFWGGESYTLMGPATTQGVTLSSRQPPNWATSRNKNPKNSRLQKPSTYKHTGSPHCAMRILGRASKPLWKAMIIFGKCWGGGFKLNGAMKLRLPKGCKKVDSWSEGKGGEGSVKAWLLRWKLRKLVLIYVYNCLCIQLFIYGLFSLLIFLFCYLFI